MKFSPFVNRKGANLDSRELPKVQLAAIHSKILALSFVVVLGCNIFNPSGEGELDESNAEALISLGQSLFRDARYADAEEQFHRALKVDSTKSEAYFGLAKAGMWRAGVNPMTLLGHVSVGQDEIPFMAEPAEVRNTYYQAMQAVEAALSPLIHRDTLTQYYEWALATEKDPTFPLQLADSTRAVLQRFTLEFGPAYEGFPLSDRKVKTSRIKVDFTLASFTTFMLGFLDINRDKVIDDKDFNITITRDSTGAVQVNVDELFEAAQTDPAVAASLNENIEEIANGTGDISNLINSLSGTLGVSTDSSSSEVSEETNAQINEQIADLGDGILFYKLNDSLDNDGDGCIDEEIFDSLDNDGDGLKDEDLRLTVSTGPLAGLDGKDNDGDGQIDEADELIVPNADPNIRLMGFVSQFQPNDIGEFNSIDKERKLAVARDTLISQPTFDLAARRQHIGGCWQFYDQTRFLAWFP